jgi:hypothetical protein
MADLGIIDIPDALPILSRGNHKPGTGKACIMDAISIVSGHPEQQDRPAAVHPLLRPLFVHLNDSATDADRQKLWTPGLKAWGTGIDRDLPDAESRRLVVALLLGQARRRLTGQRVADHPAVRLLPATLAWQQQPTYQSRKTLQRATFAARTHAAGGCRGCSLVISAAAAVREVTSWGHVQFLRDGLFGNAAWQDKLEALDTLLDDWLVMLPAVQCRQPEPVTPFVPWETLSAELGVTVGAGA